MVKAKAKAKAKAGSILTDIKDSFVEGAKGMVFYDLWGWKSRNTRRSRNLPNRSPEPLRSRTPEPERRRSQSRQNHSQSHQSRQQNAENHESHRQPKNHPGKQRLQGQPKDIWEDGTWLYVALGDTYYLWKKYDEAINYLFEALKCPDGLGNPFILLKIGECFYEMKNIKKAQEYLLQAYMYEGEEIFAGEESKYIKIIENMV